MACEVSKFVDKTDLTREKIFWSKCITVATIYTSLGEARKHKHTENRHMTKKKTDELVGKQRTAVKYILRFICGEIDSAHSLRIS